MESFAFGMATAPRVFRSPTSPKLFLCSHKGLHVIVCLDDILVLTHSKHADKRTQTFLCPPLVCLGLHFNFLGQNSITHSCFLFWAYVRIQLTCLCLCHLTNLLGSSSWLMHCYRAIWYSSQAKSFWARPCFLPVDMHILLIVTCHSK